MSAPAGWYQDAAGVPRWWDGQRWVDAQSSLRISPDTNTSTPWIWLIVLLPIIANIPLIGYFMQMQQSLADLLAVMPEDGSRPDVRRILEVEAGLLFTPWYLVLIVSGWVLYGASVWFAARDARELSTRGVSSPFPWVWSFLAPLVYVIGRHVVIRRRGGRGSGPLVASIIILVLGVVVVIALNIVFVLGILSETLQQAPGI